MAIVNLKKRQIECKIVYYGPGRCGKTTNLEYIHKAFNNQVKGDMVSIKTDGDRTLFFDFLPLEIGKLKGCDVRVQLYTVPGQVKYNATRKLVLKGVDGLVFVADMQKERQEANIKSLEQMKENLLTHSKDISKIPLVLQYNKIDLEKEGVEMLTVEEMQHDLNRDLNVPAYTASALVGNNVVGTLKKIISMTLISFRKELE